MNGLINFNNTMTLSTTYTGSCIILWPGAGTSSSTDWHGFGMNSGQVVYNVPSSQMHSFQANGVQTA